MVLQVSREEQVDRVLTFPGAGEREIQDGAGEGLLALLPGVGAEAVGFVVEIEEGAEGSVGLGSATAEARA